MSLDPQATQSFRINYEGGKDRASPLLSTSSYGFVCKAWLLAEFDELKLYCHATWSFPQNNYVRGAESRLS